MHDIARRSSFICARCLRARAKHLNSIAVSGARRYSEQHSPPEPTQDGAEDGAQEAKEKGAMSRRLAEMSDASLESGGRSARNAVQEAGFSDDLKKQLEARIANATFRNEHASAFAQADMPSSAGRGTRDIAAAPAWTGTETVTDASLRMLTDAHKPLRIPSKIPGIGGPPPKVDTGRSKTKPSSGARLANARDKTSIYSYMKDPNVSDKEREKMRQDMKDRFQPGARAVPATLQGLASLANERIEDAIARGQFKNLPRGKTIERDYNASSPFLDTTEYFMNKIIQKQDIVPPWIEKQQELVSTATKFRSRLRADWRRHVARSISSRGGGLQRQMQLAEEYALAESIENPSKTKVETINTVADGCQVSQITLGGELKAGTASNSSNSISEIRITEQAVDDSDNVQDLAEQNTITAESTRQEPQPAQPENTARRPSVPPFRDAKWEETERSYHTLAVENLNSLTRSYNLMAPNLAKKPYFSLARELRACFADVAPQVAGAIRERALAPKLKGVDVVGHAPGGVLHKLVVHSAAVHDERRPRYGLREFWRDLFART